MRLSIHHLLLTTFAVLVIGRNLPQNDGNDLSGPDDGLGGSGDGSSEGTIPTTSPSAL